MENNLFYSKSTASNINHSKNATLTEILRIEKDLIRHMNMVAQCISYSSAGLIKYHGQRQLKAERVCFGKRLHRKILLWKNPKKEKNIT